MSWGCFFFLHVICFCEFRKGNQDWNYQVELRIKRSSVTLSTTPSMNLAKNYIMRGHHPSECFHKYQEIVTHAYFFFSFLSEADEQFLLLRENPIKWLWYQGQSNLFRVYLCTSAYLIDFPFSRSFKHFRDVWSSIGGTFSRIWHNKFGSRA